MSADQVHAVFEAAREQVDRLARGQSTDTTPLRKAARMELFGVRDQRERSVLAGVQTELRVLEPVIARGLDSGAQPAEGLNARNALNQVSQSMSEAAKVQNLPSGRVDADTRAAFLPGLELDPVVASGVCDRDGAVYCQDRAYGQMDVGQLSAGDDSDDDDE